MQKHNDCMRNQQLGGNGAGGEENGRVESG